MRPTDTRGPYEREPLLQTRLEEAAEDERRRRLYRNIGVAALTLLAVSLVFGIIWSVVTPTDDGDTEGAARRRSVHTTILVTLDGWRHDYTARAPNISRFAAEGVQARLEPVFPTKTLPNHGTILTGLWPEHHGLVANTFRDPELGIFSIDNRTTLKQSRWWAKEAEPIWVTAERAFLRTGALYFPGASARIEGARPSLWRDLDAGATHNARVEELLAWLDLEEARRPQLVMLHMDATDGVGHLYGPASSRMLAAILEARPPLSSPLEASRAQIDNALGLLMEGLRARGVENETNVLLVSDHGMAQLDKSRIVLVDQLNIPYDVVDWEKAAVDWSPNLALWPGGDAEVDRLYKYMKNAHPHLSVYKKAEIPHWLHYRDSDRIPPLLAMADPGWSIATSVFAKEHPEFFRGGNHGYDPNVGTDMHGLFAARGPSFAADSRVGPVQTIDLYPLLAFVLKLEAPHKIDGDLDRVRAVLRGGGTHAPAPAPPHNAP